MSRFTAPTLRRTFGQLVTETPFSNFWVSAIRFCIPSNNREWSDISRTWTIDPKHYKAVKHITEYFYGNNIVDLTGGFNDIAQDDTGIKKLDEYIAKSNDRFNRHKKEKEREQRQSPFGSRGTSIHRSTLYVTEDAPGFVVTAVYRALAKHYHPDMPTGNADIMKKINNAFDELKKQGLT